ncbi:Xaa-Pro-dipeptidase [Mesoplasma florum L1]|uniref:Xaa-Pro-dipeptidase n=1 Tax=Mesoplasma florum (strain ATCC 33453 / NBRC 100688 / NCTC 11704 / L1) TaxID=265311 RepID=Q6F185_MESFL|nr:aminopeptidase P family protein [Mesoplasma florum]AAT75738.1 Xaa-Pro-dipeptidase [Mesoplasma florum L1]ATI74020.1 aminopeptidase P family protein [Mesoplasma florum]AVN61054.1 aminopeptidase P family protein [Mesoplasma florum]
MKKQEIVNKLLESNSAEAILFYSPENRYWFSRFKSSLGYLLITKTKSYLLVDGRYITAARNSNNIPKDIEIREFSNNLFVQMKEILKEHNVKKLGFESDWVHYAEFEKYASIFTEQTLVPINCSEIRIVKDEWEIEQLQKACDITNEVFEAILEYVKPGMTEKELQRFVDNEFLVKGAEKISFDTIIASGVNGSMPHAVPTDKKIEIGDLVTIDMGCYYNGYCSDQTRTIAIGEIDAKLEDIYNAVYEAQSLGISLVSEGVNAGEIHKQVYDFIEKRGYGGYFTHGLGHGYGVEIHEEPYASAAGNTILKENMTLTIEPGIYIPGLGGVRIEDDILVLKDGYRMLTSATRELVKLKF